MMRQRRQEITYEKSLMDRDVEATFVGTATSTAAEHAEEQSMLSSETTISGRNATARRRRIRVWRILVVLGMFFVVVLVMAAFIILQPRNRRVHVSCPSRVSKSANDIPTENAEYERVTNQIKTNLTEYMQTFRNSTFDSWGRTYDKVKMGMYPWKSSRFAPFLNNGDSIYESACGIGMNLYMTLEILNEIKGIESLVIYGNEYVSLSAEVANAVYDANPPFRAQKGAICPGDSAKLDFVPSNSFDLVYTGYIT